MGEQSWVILLRGGGGVDVAEVGVVVVVVVVGECGCGVAGGGDCAACMWGAERGGKKALVVWENSDGI